MNIVDSSISRPSSASPNGKPSGPAVSMGSVQGHYVQQVAYVSTVTQQRLCPTVSHWGLVLQRGGSVVKLYVEVVFPAGRAREWMMGGWGLYRALE